MTSIVHRDTPFVAVKKCVMNFSAAIEKDHSASFLAARIVGIVNDMNPPYFLTGDYHQAYQRYIRVAKVFLLRPRMLSIIDDGSRE